MHSRVTPNFTLDLNWTWIVTIVVLLLAESSYLLPLELMRKSTKSLSMTLTHSAASQLSKMKLIQIVEWRKLILDLKNDVWSDLEQLIKLKEDFERMMNSSKTFLWILLWKDNANLTQFFLKLSPQKTFLKRWEFTVGFWNFPQLLTADYFNIQVEFAWAGEKPLQMVQIRYISNASYFFLLFFCLVLATVWKRS